MSLKYFKIAVIIIIIQFIIALYIGMALPDDAKIPSHWNLQGEIDGWSNKWTGILLFPGVNLIILLLGVFFPTLSPRYRNDPKRFQKILPSFLTILVICFSLIHIYSLLIARGTFSTSGNLILAILGLLFIGTGNLMPKLPSNFYMGVRLPWTLSSETVWRKTHRLAGWSFFLGGMIFVAAGFLGKITSLANFLLIAALILIIIIPILGAFIIYKQENIE